MALGFSDLSEEYEYQSEMYDSSCTMLGTSDDSEYAEKESEKHDKSCSILGVHT